MFHEQKRGRSGFTLIELVVVAAALGVLAAVAMPRFLTGTREVEKASVTNIVSGLESALRAYTARQLVNRQPIAIHNPFDDLCRLPANYGGVKDSITESNTPDGHWSYCRTSNWIVYNPESKLIGGWGIDEQFIIYQVQAVVDGSDTIGLRLTTSSMYTYSW